MNFLTFEQVEYKYYGYKLKIVLDVFMFLSVLQGHYSKQISCGNLQHVTPWMLSVELKLCLTRNIPLISYSD